MSSKSDTSQSQEQIALLKSFLSKELGLKLDSLPGFKDVYRLNTGMTIAIQYSKYHPKQYHYWFAIVKRKFESLQPNESFFLLICQDINLVYVLPTLYLEELFNEVPQEKASEKWAFNILTKHRLRLYGRKEYKEDISAYMNKFAILSLASNQGLIKSHLNVNRRGFFLPEEINGENYWEGMVEKVIVNRYERDSSAREACLRAHGFSCSVCKFNFEQKYGSIGQGYIHVHHIRPLSKIKSGYEPNPLTDLKPVCPNCHAMFHAQENPLSIEELKGLIASEVRKNKKFSSSF